MTSSQFLDDCSKRCHEYLERGRRVAMGVPTERLNHRPLSGEWSPAQVYQHLVLADTPYEPLMLDGARSLPMDASNQEVQNTWIGRFIAKQAGPGTNAPAPKAWVPQDAPLPESIVEEWASQFERMIGTIELCRGKDLNTKFMRNPMLTMFKMNMADCILILTNHTERHIGQIEERLAGSC